MASRPLDWLAEHPSLDWLMASAAVGAHAGVVAVFGRFDALGALQAEERADIYTSALEPIAIVVGFTLAALGFMYGTSGRRMALVRDRGHDALTRTWIGAVSGPMAAVAILLCAAVAEQGGAQGARWVAEGVAALLTFRTIRFLWLLREMLGLRRADDNDVEKPAPTTLRERQRQAS